MKPISMPTELAHTSRANNLGLPRQIEGEIHYVHWASKAYEDESVIMYEAHLGWQ